MFFGHKHYPSMKRLSNRVCTVTQLLKPINLRNQDDGEDTLSETSVRTSAARRKDIEGTCNCAVVFECQAYPWKRVSIPVA
jgi:hypothetical protein